MEPHVKEAEIISRKEHDNREKILNAHGKQIARVLRIGEKGGDRVAKGCRDGMRKVGLIR